MRLGISHVLDAIERRISTDPAEVSAVLDLAEVVRMVDLDGGRPASLLRLGATIDALARHLCDNGARIYVVADRALLSDTDLTANERMVVRRWSDDGLAEVLLVGPPATVRVREVAALTGIPLLTRDRGGFAGLAYAPMPGPSGTTLTPHGAAAPLGRPSAALGRRWQCPEAGCASFGQGRALPDGSGQPPVSLPTGRPVCPRHGAPLADVGPATRRVLAAIRLDGAVWQRFAVSDSEEVAVGRHPEERGGIGVGHALDEAGLAWVSRSHLRVELRGQLLQVTDTSTNGSVLLGRAGPGAAARRTPLTRGESATLGEWDTVELYQGLELGRADRGAGPVPGMPVASVLAEAPTQSMRLSTAP